MKSLNEQFLLRMKSRHKEIAKVLAEAGSKVSIRPENVFTDAKTIDSVNTALLVFIEFGIQVVLDWLEKEHKEMQVEYDNQSEMAMFLLSNPKAEEAKPNDFPKGSNARKYIQEWIEDGDSETGTGIDRSIVLFGLHEMEKRMNALSTAIIEMRKIYNA